MHRCEQEHQVLFNVDDRLSIFNNSEGHYAYLERASAETPPPHLQKLVAAVQQASETPAPVMAETEKLGPQKLQASPAAAAADQTG